MAVGTCRVAFVLLELLFQRQTAKHLVIGGSDPASAGGAVPACQNAPQNQSPV